jgi:hypothetical protein
MPDGSVGAKKSSLSWFWQLITFSVAAVLNLSQKRSPLAVNLLLVLCAFLTFWKLDSMKWWQSSNGKRRWFLRIAQFPVVGVALWIAIAFFRFHVPPISYPWIATNFSAVGPNGIQDIRLQVQVHDNPPLSGPSKGIATPSSLRNVNVRITTPVALGAQNSWYSCPVGQLSANTWNNSLSSQRVVGIVQLNRPTTILEIQASSENAQWSGVAVVHKNGDHADWEEYLSGYALVDGEQKSVIVSEVRKDNVTTVGADRLPLPLSRQFLINSGLPILENGQSAPACPPVQSY